MLLKTLLVRYAEISFTKNTVIKFDDNIEFTLVPVEKRNFFEIYDLKVENIKGDFEFVIMKPQILDPHVSYLGPTLPYNKDTHTFTNLSLRGPYEFHITADVNFKKVDSGSNFVKVKYSFHLPAVEMQKLKFYECYEKCLILPGYDYLAFKYFVKKIGEDLVEVVIINPYDVKLSSHKNAKTAEKGNFRYESKASDDIDITLYFIFDTNLFDINGNNITTTNENISPSTFPNPFLNDPCQSQCEWRKKITDMQYCDVHLLSSDGDLIPCHRSILAHYSNYFANEFNNGSNDVPSKINTGFNRGTIVTVLNLLYGKTQMLEGNVVDVFKFSIKYEIRDLKTACCSYFEANADPSNACELIQLAFLHNYEKLKQKCKTVVLQKKAEIEPLKLKDLSQEILYYIFCV